MRLPAMPSKNSDGLGVISTITRRPSNCSERFLTNAGQCSAPGISSFSAAIIWQPLQAPSANVSRRAKNCSNSARTLELNRIVLAQPRPAPSTSP